MMKLLKRIKCKLFVCCKSQCSLNDTNGNGIVDEVQIKSTIK